MRRFSWIIILFVIIFPFYWSESASARPAELPIFPISDEHAVVYDENSNGSPDLFGDTWIFDMDGNNSADLIIRFRQTPTLTAFIYDDTNSNGQVDYQIGDTQIQILEPHWRVQVISRDGKWVLPSGVSDWNLDLQFDSGFAFVSGVPAIPHTSSCSNAQGTTTAIQLSDKTIGNELPGNQSNLQVRYWDLNGDGTPDHEWHNMQIAGPFDILIVNENPTLLYKPSHRFPLLDTVLWINWGKAHIQAVRPLIPDHGEEAGYVLRFDHAVTSGLISAAIDNPSAYYDLQSNNACIPDLIIHAISNDHDQTRSNVAAYNQINYSWAQSGNSIQYRLFLLGQVFTSQLNTYPAFSVPHIPYTDLPSFVLDNNWQAASFAEMENPARALALNELPENPYYIATLSKSLSGWQNIKLPDDYLPVFLSLREEYNFQKYDRLPRLYLSSVDRRLHLLGAQQGIIIFSADTANASPGFDFSLESLASGKATIQSATIYTDTDADGYIDTWFYQENGQPVRALVVRPGVALLAQTNSLLIKRLPLDFNPYAWEARPPATPAEWSTYQEKLTPVQKTRRRLNDLSGIFSDLPGDEFTIPNTSLQSVSINGQSLAAQITTLGFSVSPNTTFITVPGGNAQAGDYVLRSNRGSLSLEHPLDANLQVTPLRLDSSDSAPSDQFGILSFSVQNPGNLDVSAQLHIWDESSSGKSPLQERKIVIPAAGHLEVNLPWSPVVGGLHHLVAQIEYNSQPGGLLLQAQQILDQNVSVSDSTVDSFFLSSSYLPQNIFLLAALILVLMGAAWVTLRSLEKTDEPPA